MKQRIIGALVLISLAVIFVPMMFDEPHDERAVRSLEIPEEPPFPEVSIPETGPEEESVPDYRIEELESPEPGGQGADTDITVSDEPAGEDFSSLTPETQRSTSAAEESAETAGTSEDVNEQSVEATPASPGDEETVTTTADETASGDAEATESATDSADFERSLAGAWVLQLGSFGNEENARRLRDRVRERGYGAHLQPVTVADTRMVRVFSGPFTDESEARKAKAVLDEAFNIQALVTQGAGQ